MSGRKIRESKRQAEINHVFYPNRGLYRRNDPEKRHVENPNIYEGDKPLRCGINTIRLPKKKRKTAWKRFHKAFPYVKVTKKGQIQYCPEKDKT